MIDHSIQQRLDRIETLLMSLSRQKDPRQFYSTAEVAEIFGKANFTVREWCRLGRIVAEKRATGHGCSKEWMVSYEEVQRIRDFGLLP